MKFEVEMDPDDVEVIDVTGDANGILSVGDVSAGRNELMQRAYAPKWMFVASEHFDDIHHDDALRDVFITKETILQNAWVDDFREAIEQFEEIVDPNAEGLLMGMNVCVSTELDGVAYIMPDDDGLPDLEHAVRVDC